MQGIVNLNLVQLLTIVISSVYILKAVRCSFVKRGGEGEKNSGMLEGRLVIGMFVR